VLKGNIRLFRIQGNPVTINWSWLFVFVLDQERLVGAPVRRLGGGRATPRPGVGHGRRRDAHR
jgi:hypothetical protein